MRIPYKMAALESKKEKNCLKCLIGSLLGNMMSNH